MRMRAGFHAVMLGGLCLATPALAEDFKRGGITVLSPWARATPGGATVAGAFLEIRAAPGADDRLVTVRSAVSPTIELHDHVSDGGVMKMRRVDAIPVSGTTPVVLKPGGLHIMMFNITAPLKEGDAVDFTLVFEKAGEMKISAKVLKVGAPGPQSDRGHDDAGSAHKMGSGSGR